MTKNLPIHTKTILPAVSGSKFNRIVEDYHELMDDIDQLTRYIDRLETELADHNPLKRAA